MYQCALKVGPFIYIRVLECLYTVTCTLAVDAWRVLNCVFQDACWAPCKCKTCDNLIALCFSLLGPVGFKSFTHLAFSLALDTLHLLSCLTITATGRLSEPSSVLMCPTSFLCTAVPFSEADREARSVKEWVREGMGGSVSSKTK